MPPFEKQDPHVVIGVGASAGGLEAFQTFMSGLPDDHDFVIILVQHLDPNHESLMPDLVSARTKSPVHSVTNDMEIEKGHVYLIPPGYEMEISGLTLTLKAFDEPRGLRRPIDRFFQSLANAHGPNAVAVVLSGTGSDGAAGAREVRGAGGLVFVQEPSQAKYDGMPQSVLDQGGADVVCAAQEIIDIATDYTNLRAGTMAEFDNDSEFLSRVSRHVRFRTGHDFTDYKEGTILRRVTVRMSALNITNPSEYLAYLVAHQEEADALYRELLINVTSFFRDTAHFDELAKTAIPELVEHAEDEGEIRVWVAGCSTGEEAYSIGILIAEEMSRTKKACRVMIFGTDIDETALSVARTGRYTDAMMEVVPRQYVDRYFRAINGGYEVGPVLRDYVRFSRHSFIKDPPFSKLDMVSCRNVLIYFKENLQELAMRVFHYGLREGGHLLIGPSENPKTIGTHFTEVSSRARLFVRKPGAARPLNLGSTAYEMSSAPRRTAPPAPPTPDHRDLHDTVLEKFAPAYFQLDSEGHVLFSSPRASDYLRIRSGTVSTRLADLIAPELESTIRRVTRLAAGGDFNKEVEFQGEVGGVDTRIVVTATPLPDQTILAVIFDRLHLRDGNDRMSTGHDEANQAYLQQLETELDESRQIVRTTVEELETSNEELKSSNEEMMSMNEELQSANEELTTINDELQEKLRELHQANADMSNFISSASVPTVFLDEELRVRRFTPEAQDYFSFTSDDHGRPLSELNSRIDHDTVLEMCHDVLNDQREREREFETKDGHRTLKVSVMPYTAQDTTQVGIVFTLLDITDLRIAIERAEHHKTAAQESLLEVEQIYNTSPLAMGLIDAEMVYLRLNDQLAAINGEPVEAHIGKTIRDVIPTVADQTEEIVRNVLKTGKAIRGQRVEGSTRSDPDNTRIWESDWAPYFTDGKPTAVSVMVRDITDEVQTTERLQHVMMELEHRVKNMLANVSALINRARREATGDAEVYEKLANRIEGLAKTHALLTAEQWSSAPLAEIIRPETVDVYGEDRVSINGPEIRVTSQATLAFGMAFHELATNAAKYGAFSVPKGRVDINWARINDQSGDRLYIEWVESGGPKVTPPERNGFGSKLISSTIEGTLAGKADFIWEPDGLRLVMSLDYKDVTEYYAPD